MFFYKTNLIFYGILYSIMLYRIVLSQMLTDDCGIDFGCFRTPDNCQDSECKFLYKYQDDGENTKFVISGQFTDNELLNGAWLGIGFSDDSLMGQDSVVICKFTTSGTNSVEQYYTNDKSVPIIIDLLNPTIGLSNSQTSILNNILNCNFTRKKNVEDFARYYDLNKPYYLLGAFGKFTTITGLRYHFDEKFASKERIDFSKNEISSGSAGITIKTKSHACLMIIAWILLASNGILFARYYKFILPNFKPCGIQFWFHIHRPVMILVLLVNVSAFIVILNDNGWKWVNPYQTIEFTHSIIGILTIFFTLVQIILGIFRPDKDSDHRFIFNHIHRCLGILSFVLATVALFLGTFIKKMDIQSIGWKILTGWLVWIVYIIIQMEIIECIQKKASQKEYATSYEMNYNKQSTLPSQPEVKLEPTRAEKTVHLMKTIILFVHLVVSLIISISLIVYISLKTK